MPNQAGIEDHNGDNTADLVKRYQSLDQRAIYPMLYTLVDKATTDGRTLRILDIGCGSGDGAYTMAEAGHHVTGLDPSDLLDVAKRDRQHPHITYHKDTLPALHSITHEEPFDLVVMSAVWQYIDPAERVDSLVKIAQKLEREGNLFISYPTPPSRAHQFEVSEEQMQADLQAANAKLPKHLQLNIGQKEIIQDSKARKSTDGRDIYFLS